MPFKTLLVKDFDSETFQWVSQINDGDIAFVIDEAAKTIYVWNGNRASMIKKYKAGTLATKIKSLYQFYGFKTVVLHQGEETGDLLAEINKLLEGKGTELSADEKASLKPVGAASTAPIVQKSVSKPEPIPEKPKVDESELIAVKEELETEKKKSAHRLAKVKEEMAEMKSKYESTIGDLKSKVSDLESKLKEASSGPDLSKELEKKDERITELENMVSLGEKEADSRVKAIQVELDFAKEKVAKLEKTVSSAPKVDEGELNGLKKENAKLKGDISSLQGEISKLKADLEKAKAAPAPAPTPAGDAKKIKALEAEIKKDAEKIKSLEREITDEKVKKEEEINEIKAKTEDEISNLKAKVDELKRKLLESPEEEKGGGSNELTFAPLDNLGKDAANSDSSSLSFVNPYSAGGTGAKVDPLNDLKSFLNTVDPSKPLDPELKDLLEVITKKMMDDSTIIESLENIKKGTKDKRVQKMVAETIKSIKKKQS
ncbi:MAG: hypothetical protein ACTSU9_08220 [Promethearchaeota archaeon]